MTQGFDTAGLMTSLSIIQGGDGRDAGYTVSLTNGTTLTRTVVRDPYRRSLVKTITNSVDGVSVATLDYAYDLLDRVTSRNTDAFGYNLRSEVTSAAIQPSHTNCYQYDNIGNNLWTSLNAATNLYSANPLNQYTNILCASAPPRETFPAYDLDGNMVSNGVWAYTWDAENRLVAAYSNATLVVSNAYDHQSRRILKVTPTATHTFVYDGWNLVQETVQTQQSTVTNRFVWGCDLSGSTQGAGGVGGLLAVQMSGAWYFPFYDNNGNIVAYVDESGELVAEYIYDAFGNAITATGPLAHAFRHCFSTKYYDAETGLYYYGYRFYSPELGRWLNRDPIEEDGSLNLYSFVRNAPVFLNDPLGLLVADRSAYGFAIFFGVGPAAGNEVIARMSMIAMNRGREFKPCKEAEPGKRCLLSLGNNISSLELRNASATYDELYFNGHGEKNAKLNPSWQPGMPLEQRWTYRTKIAFSNGWMPLSEVLILPQVQASVIVPYVCYDFWLDESNPSGIRVCKPFNSRTPNPSWLGVALVDAMIRRFIQEKCCALDVKGP